MISPRLFLSSPLAREPRLLAWKILGKLRGPRKPIPPREPDPEPALRYPESWGPALRAWLSQFPRRAGPHRFDRVFGIDFDEALLLDLCRTGPRTEEPGLKADIKLIWDYSRGYALVGNAWAGTSNLGLCVAFIRRWMAANPSTQGPAWRCPMDVSIRAVNWIAADLLFDGALGNAIGTAEWSEWLWRSGWLIWRDPEARIVSSNHYLANLLGLLVIGSCFPEDARARRWRDFAQRDFPRALLAQTRADGGLNEGSLRYHAYVTEMALLFRLFQDRPLPAKAEARLAEMCQIVADFADAAGDVFPFGDDDSGRVLALDWVCDSPRVDILLGLAARLLGRSVSANSAAFCPESGWWIRRSGPGVCAIDFGGVGCRGLGAHAHNDDLSICVEWGGCPLIVDPGTYLYTGDPAARDRFRSTRSHNTVMVDSTEQRKLGGDVFLLHGSDRPLKARETVGGGLSAERADPSGVIHRRGVSFASRQLLVTDHLVGVGMHDIEWRFHLHPSVRAVSQGRHLVATTAGGIVLALQTSHPELEVSLERYRFSPGYGRATEAWVWAARAKVELPLQVAWTLGEVPSQPGESAG